MPDRVLRVTNPHVKGDDVEKVQRALNRQFKDWRWQFRVSEDGDWGVGSRSAAALVLHGNGLPAKLAGYFTPTLQRKVIHRDYTAVERALALSRRPWRRRQRKRFETRVASPLNTITADSWGWVPGVHDGIDLICPPESPIFAVCDAEVVRADTGGWWGKAPSGDVSKGDGIIIIRATADVGPIRRGMNLCYGHAEHPTVRVGQRVTAGQVIGRAGLAVAWHVHLMCNMRADTRGIGDFDPRPVYEFCRKNGRR